MVLIIRSEYIVNLHVVASTSVSLSAFLYNDVIYKGYSNFIYVGLALVLSVCVYTYRSKKHWTKAYNTRYKASCTLQSKVAFYEAICILKNIKNLHNLAYENTNVCMNL